MGGKKIIKQVNFEKKVCKKKTGWRKNREWQEIQTTPDKMGENTK